jgi:hypothetical protein
MLGRTDKASGHIALLKNETGIHRQRSGRLLQDVVLLDGFPLKAAAGAWGSTEVLMRTDRNAMKLALSLPSKREYSLRWPSFDRDVGRPNNL